MMGKSVFLGVAVALAVVLALAGCGGSDSGDSSSSSGSAGGGSAAGKVTGVSREAVDAVMAEIQKRWVKRPDGWTSALTSGSPYSPDHYLGQCREITVEGVENIDLSESDKMNGVEWNGQVSFKRAPYREVGDPGMAFEAMFIPNVNRQRGQWTQWVDFQPDAVHVWKAKGKWQVDPDTFLLRDNKAMPTAADFAKAGVK